MLTVLVVIDDARAQEKVIEALALHDCQVVNVKSFDHAKGALAAITFDMMILSLSDTDADSPIIVHARKSHPAMHTLVLATDDVTLSAAAKPDHPRPVSLKGLSDLLKLIALRKRAASIKLRLPKRTIH